MANTYAYRTMDLTADGGYTSRFVFSAWVKRSKLSYNYAPLFSIHKNNSNTASKINCYFNSSNDLIFVMQDSGGNADSEYQTDRKFRDTNCWYHIYLAFNSTLTAADRLQIYVNGVRETSFSTSNEVGSGFGALMSSSMDFRIGLMKDGSGNPYYFDGLMNSAIFTNYQSGTVDPVTDFGEVDSTTGEWKIKVSPDVTYASQGVFVLKNGNSLTDQSGQSNNMTVGGTLTKTEDCPSNVFATMNPLISQTAGVAGRNNPIDAKFFNGNTTIATSVAYWTPQLGNMEMFSGKYYWEQKFEVDGTPSNYLSWIGIEATDTAGTNLGSPSATNANGIAYGTGGVVNKSGSSQSGSWSTWTAGDIVMCAVDLDNNYIYFGKNGTWQNSGVPTSGGSGTGGVAVTTGKSYITASTIHRGGNYSINTTYSYAKSNFGNGYFGTTAVASAGTNASGNGIFEYDVPTGYTALSTKGLNL